MYPKFSPSPNKKSVHQLPQYTRQEQSSRHYNDGSQPRNQLYSSFLSKYAPNASGSVLKNSQQIFEARDLFHNSNPVPGNTIKMRTSQITPASQPSQTHDTFDNKKKTYNSTQGISKPKYYNGNHDQEEYNLPVNNLKKRNLQSTSFHDQESHRSRTSQFQSAENAYLRKHLTKEIRVSLGTYALEKLLAKLNMKAAFDMVMKWTPMYRSKSSKKMFRSIVASDLKKSKVTNHPQDEENSFGEEPMSQRHLTPRRWDNSQENPERGSKKQDPFRHQGSLEHLQSKITKSEPSESTWNGHHTPFNSVKDDQEEMLFGKRVDMRRAEEDTKLKRRENAIKIIQKAIVVIQRCFRKYLERKRNAQRSTKITMTTRKTATPSNKSPRLERENSQPRKTQMTERRHDVQGSQILIEQLTNELSLAKKKASYLQAENQKLETELKNIERNLEKTIAERLTIERTRVKDSLKDYNIFIDKLLEEKKELESKAESNTKLITELCSRLENNSIQRVQELEEQIKEMVLEKQTMYGEYEKLRLEVQTLSEEKKQFIPVQQYQDIINERDLIQKKLSDLQARFFNLESVVLKLQSADIGVLEITKDYTITSEEQSVQSKEDLLPNTKNKNRDGGTLQSDPSLLVDNQSFENKNISSKTRRNERICLTTRNEKPNSIYQSTKTFQQMDAGTRSLTPTYKGKVSKLSLSYAEPEIKSARSLRPLEFSFEVKEAGEVEFNEPFRLSVTLEEQSKMNNKSSGKKNVQQLQRNSSSQEFQGNKKQEFLERNIENESLDINLDDLIMNLDQKLQSHGHSRHHQDQEWEVGKNKSRKCDREEDNDLFSSQTLRKTKREEIRVPSTVKFGVLETLKQADNIFQKFSKGSTKS